MKSRELVNILKSCCFRYSIQTPSFEMVMNFPDQGDYKYNLYVKQGRIIYQMENFSPCTT